MSREYRILCDSTADMPWSYYEERDVKLACMSYTVDGEEYVGAALSPKEFYDKLRAGSTATTAQINMDVFTKSFEEEIAAGRDVLYLCFSSGLSGTCNSAQIAAEDVMERHPEAKVIVVDSLAASAGEGLLLDYLVENKKKGMTLEENAAWAVEHRLNLAHWFTVDDLNHLYRGGRVSKTAAVVGTLLGIKPVLHVDNEGHLIPMEKVRGRQASLEGLVRHMREDGVDLASQKIFISHGDCRADAEKVAEMVKSEFGVREVLIADIGPVVGAHSGPGTVALFYMGKKR